MCGRFVRGGPVSSIVEIFHVAAAPFELSFTSIPHKLIRETYHNNKMQVIEYVTLSKIFLYK